MPLIFLLVFLFSIAIAPAAFALDGEGTKDNPYLITSQKDLEDFRDIVNGGGNGAGAHAKLTKDITLDFDEGESWTPIANYSYDNQIRYTGTFDGGGHTIYELTVDMSSSYAGFFGRVGEGGVVKNLTIASDGRVSGYMYFGSIAGLNAGIVENCANSATVSGDWYTGGIVGWNAGTVQNCTNSATVSGNSYLGGIVGYNNGIVQNCTNSATVSGTRYTGGIVGYNNNGIVQNCTNSVTVSGNSYVGGVVGYNYNTVQNCINLGNVSGTSQYVGGVVGYNYNTVQNCINLGNVSGGTYVGGVVGYNTNYDTTVQNCGYLQDRDVNNGINAAIGGGTDNGTNVGSFSSEDEAQIAVTLSASIADSAIAANGQTTITLTTQPGTASYVINAKGLAVTDPYDSNSLVTITPLNEDGTLTVSGNGINAGETTITVTAALYTYKYDTKTYDTTDVASTYNFTFNLTVNDVADDEETGTPGGEESGGDNDEEETGGGESGDDNDDDSGLTESGGASGGSGGGGCNAGTGALALLALIPLALRKKR